MVLIRIVSSKEEKLVAIASLILEERLGIDVNIKRNIERLTLVDGKVRSTSVHLLTSKTKALLFPKIDKRIREIYAQELPEIYSVPIVHMDWEQSEQLIEEVVGI